MKRFFQGVWEFISFLFVPQQAKYIMYHAQSYD